MRKRVVIADDHKLFLEGIVGMLSSVDGLELVGKAYTGSGALKIIRSTKPDLVILDITMPEVNGIVVTRTIKKELPETKILILSMHLDRRMILEALKAGADGYVLKEAEPKELLAALEIVSSGLICLSPEVTTLIIHDYIQKIELPATSEQLKELSAREREVLSLISEGRNAREISEKLCICRNTVDAHRRNLMQKLGCGNLTGLIRYSMREGLMNLDE